jgi:hypothetical protein
VIAPLFLLPEDLKNSRKYVFACIIKIRILPFPAGDKSSGNVVYFKPVLDILKKVPLYASLVKWIENKIPFRVKKMRKILSCRYI